MISVILPVFNAEKTIKRAINSILEQRNINFELILINDGSTDQTTEILDEFKSDRRIKLLNQENQGIVSALNNGIKASSGKFIARMDADDYSYPDRLMKQLELFQNKPNLDLVSCKVDFGGNIEAQKGYSVYVNWINQLVSHDEISLNRFIESPLAHPSVIFKRNAIERWGAYREGSFPEDYEIWLRFLENGARMEKVNEVLLTWNDPPERLSRNNDRYSLDAFFEIKAEYLSRWLKKHSTHEILCWGAGRVSRKRAEKLEKYGCQIAGFIDVNPNLRGQKINNKPIYLYNELKLPLAHPIVSFVNNRGARDKIREWCQDNQLIEGKDIIFAA